jgi:hypothetical protein
MISDFRSANYLLSRVVIVTGLVPSIQEANPLKVVEKVVTIRPCDLTTAELYLMLQGRLK